MNKIDIVKNVVGFAVGAGVAKISKDIIKNNVSVETTYQKVIVASGAAVIGMMAKDASKAYASNKIDSAVKSLKTAKNKIDENQKSE